MKDINEKVRLFQADIDLLDQALNQDGLDETTKRALLSQKRSKVYQQQYQQALKNQIGGIIDKLHSDSYTTIDKYLKQCYEDGYIGTMYDIAKQGIPIIAPIDQAAMVRAILTDSKIVEGYYKRLGVNYAKLKKVITQEVSRGIATSLPYADIARNINNASNSGLFNAKRIARTEGHRIQQTSTRDAQWVAKSRGANVLKQWDATLDGRTRPSHAKIDGEIRETDEEYSNGLMFPGDSSGPAAEVINCRCVSKTRARWALDADELQKLQDRAAFFGLDKTENFEDFKGKYLKATKEEVKIEPVKAVQFDSGEKANQFFYYDDYEKSHGLLARKNSQHGKWQSGLSADEHDCICDYTGSGYYDLNNYLRHVGDWQSIDAAKEEFIAKSIDSAISRYELKDTILVQRGVMNDVIDRLAEEHDVQYSLSELVGKKYVENGYSSTTVLHGNRVATAKPTVLDIEIPAGVGRGAYVNQLAGQFEDTEYEFLIKRGASFTIKEVVEEEVMGEYHYYVKLVMDVE